MICCLPPVVANSKTKQFAGNSTAKICQGSNTRLNALAYSWFSSKTTKPQDIEKEATKNKWNLEDLVKTRLDHRSYTNDLPGQLFVATPTEMEQHFQDGKLDELLKSFGEMTLRDLKPLLDMKNVSEEAINARKTIGFLPIDKEVLTKMIEEASTIEERLDKIGFILFGGATVSTEYKIIQDRFSEEVQSAFTCHFSSRDPEMALVLGPSGIGKTFFAVKGIRSAWPQVQDASSPKYQYQCTLFTILSDIIRENETPKELGQKLFTKIKDHLARHGWRPSDENDKLDMVLWIVCDEAYSLRHMKVKPNNDDDSNNSKRQGIITFEVLHEIYDELRPLAECVRLVFAGTGLDELTTRVESNRQVPKFRMKRWGIDNLYQIIDKQVKSKNERTELKKFINGDELYSQLATNARAAYYLVQSARNFFKSTPAKSAADGILRQVANEYIINNGLVDVAEKDKKRIVRAVFQILNHASDPFMKAAWPLDDVPKLKITHDERRLVLALLEINVESRDNVWHRVDENSKYNASVSPAIAAILFYALGIFSDLEVLNWRSFENLAARHELQQLLVESLDENPEIGMQQLKKPFPPPKGDITGIPLVKQGRVLVNGLFASFADVITQNRLIQCKYTDSPQESVALDIREEFQKMGLSGESKIRQKLVMAALLKTFQIPQEDLKKAETITKEQTTVNHHQSVTAFGNPTEANDFRRVYPNSFFLRQLEGENCTFIESKWIKKTNTMNLGSIGTWRGDKISLDSENCYEKLIVVFYTNAVSFKVSSGNGKPTVVCVSDVDSEGRIKNEEKKEKLREHLMNEKVKALVDVGALRFQFVPYSSGVE